ncbi:protein phosphatase CheZ [Blastochloris viridis]|nr:protein phosphatase CheZ [Blastochloris viridis]CUU43136.1 chemotaxis regulator CheZ [Blastochloris viridis]
MEVSLSDVVALAEITAESLQAFFVTLDKAVYRELREIAEYIQSMKEEIGALQVHDLKETRIPAAGLELDAIVKATEAATNSIMTAAEEIMSADASDPDAYKAFVDERMMAVFEACSFQDITGQRIAKVVETLKAIESRVGRFAEATRTRDAGGFASDEEATRAARAERLLLHGPQLAGQGVSQSDVDSMLNDAAPAKPVAAPVAAKPAPAPEKPAMAAPAKPVAPQPAAVAKPAPAPAAKPAPAAAKPAAPPAAAVAKPAPAVMPAPSPAVKAPPVAPTEATDPVDRNSQDDIDKLFA